MQRTILLKLYNKIFKKYLENCAIIVIFFCTYLSLAWYDIYSES